MGQDDKSSGGVPGGGLIVFVLLAVGALVITKQPLETSRPPVSESQRESREAAQDVNARLWQDPFGAVSKAREPALKSSGGLGEDRKRHSEQRFVEEMQRQVKLGGDAGVFVVAVMLFSGPYAEQVESRRRMRYAVLAGLKARGFAPSDNEHLGYFYPHDGEGPKNGLPETVPFESFETDVDDQVCNVCRLVVLWLDSSALSTDPLRALTTLAARTAPPSSLSTVGNAPRVRWRVLGPASSDGLRAVIDEAKSENFTSGDLEHFDFRFFSSGATAPDAILLHSKPTDNTTVSEYLASRGVPLLRTIGTDDVLAKTLIKELQGRGLHTKLPDEESVECQDASQIAIITEADTLYGRTLRNQFQYKAKTTTQPGQEGFCVTRWQYFRGIDGRLPGDAAQSTSDSRTKNDSKPDSAEAVGRDGAYIERPEGQSQYDYLRRLANGIRAEDEELRKGTLRSDKGIRAVGVLGNDVYDKLLVLQALQSELPHAIFFTTDIDARLIHPRQQAWARNLIVASNFGLILTTGLQRDIAPFRDSYQTSAYLGTLLLIADISASAKDPKAGPHWRQSEISRWFKDPRLFEVSRSGAFDFSEPLDGAREGVSQPLNGDRQRLVSRDPEPAPGDRMSRCGRRTPGDCREIHPSRSPMWPHWSFSARFLIFFALTSALWAPTLALSRGGWRRARRFVAASGPSEKARLRRFGGLVIVLAALAIGPALLLACQWPDIAGWMTEGGKGKPLLFTDGISPWPTYLIRIATFVLCTYFVWHAWSFLASNADRIAHEFRLGPTRRRLNEMLEAKHKHTRWQLLKSMISVRFYQERASILGASRTPMSPRAESFWMHYIVQNRFGARLLRTALCVVVIIAVNMLIMNALGDAPSAPQRGTRALWLHFGSLIPAVLMVQVLIFFVADATVLCVFFVRGLRLHQASWPWRTLQAFKTRIGVPIEYLDDWIDLRFVARRTRCVGALIYYPFIAMSLLLLSRSAFFDDWYAGAGLNVVVALSFGIVLACALTLRRSAEASRRHALTRIRDAIARVKGEAGNAALASQLDALRDRMEHLREGAFAPYSQQPLLKAVLLPLMTFGGSQLFEYLTLANL